MTDETKETGAGVDPRVRRVSHITLAVIGSLATIDRSLVMPALLFAYRYFASAAGDPDMIRTARELLAEHDRELAKDEQAAVAATHAARH